MANNFTHEIFREECVGDSVAKHNFNFLSLDSVVCNLSSLFYKTTNNNIPLFSTMLDLCANKKNFTNNLSLMVNPIRLDRSFNGIALLSSYWDKQEITVEYEFNKSRLKPNIVDDFFLFTEAKTFSSELTSRGYEYISEVYPASSFNSNCVLNLIVPIYANDGSIVASYKYDEYDAKNKVIVPKTTTTVPVFDKIASSSATDEVRLLEGSFSKKDSNFNQIRFIKYKNINNNWTFTNFLSSTCPDVVSLTPTVQDVTNTGVGTSIQGAVGGFTQKEISIREIAPDLELTIIASIAVDGSDTFYFSGYDWVVVHHKWKLPGAMQFKYIFTNRGDVILEHTQTLNSRAVPDRPYNGGFGRSGFYGVPIGTPNNLSKTIQRVTASGFLDYPIPKCEIHKFTKLQGRSELKLETAPTKKNNWVTTVLLNDDGPSSAAWYSFKMVFKDIPQDYKL